MKLYTGNLPCVKTWPGDTVRGGGGLPAPTRGCINASLQLGRASNESRHLTVICLIYKYSKTPKNLKRVIQIEISQKNLQKI